MQDVAIPMITESVAQEQQWSRFCTMHDRLVKWGKILLQGAKGSEPWDDDWREPLPKRVWTAQQEAAAWATDREVRRLDPRLQAVLRVFYKAREAEYWAELDLLKQAALYEELCREFNDRWRIYCAQVQILPVTLRGYHFGPLRIKAVQLLYTHEPEIAIDNQRRALENARDTRLGTCAP